MKVLIVEDNPAHAALATEYILAGNLHGIEAPDVVGRLDAALELLRKNGYSVLIADLNLPDANGVEVYRQISAAAPDLPVVILSGNEDEALASSLVSLGAQDYLIKSDLNPRLMRRSLVYAIERKGLEEKLREKNRALAAAQSELIHAAKMESTGHLAAGVAHEVRNPLAVIQLGIDNLVALQRLEKKPNPLADKCLHRMQSALDRADSILRELLDFSSDQDFCWGMEDLNLTIEKAISLIHPQLVRSKVSVERCFGEKLPLVRIDRRKIEQAIINLLVNSEQAISEGGKPGVIRITTEPETATRDGKRSHVSILVEDSGPGVPAENLAKVFDAFYTTKGPSKGTGLGMTVVLKIIQLHEGSITLGSSASLGGLAALVRLPLTEGKSLAGVME